MAEVRRDSQIGAVTRPEFTWESFEVLASKKNLRSKIDFQVSFIEALPLGLMRLGVSDNELGYLPPKLARLTKLRYLSAANNQIEFIPENVCRTTSRYSRFLILSHFARKSI